MQGIFAEMGYTVDPQQYAILVPAFQANQNQIDDLSDVVLGVIYDIFNAGAELEEEDLHKYLGQVHAAIEEYNNDVYFDYDHNEEDEWKEMPPPPFSVMEGILAEYNIQLTADQYHNEFQILWHNFDGESEPTQEVVDAVVAIFGQ